MTRLASVALAHPRRMLAGWLVVIGVLAVLGLGVEDQLHRSSLDIDGTPSSRAAALAQEHFGDSASLVVLLDGPRQPLERQGRRLVAELEDRPSLTVLSPWAPGAGESLRPNGHQALLIVRSQLPLEEVSREVVPDVRARVDRLTGDPVAAHVSGYPDIGAGIHSSSVEALRQAELIAAPLLLLVLLLVFRSPVAAAVPLVIGVTTIAAGSGVLGLVNRWIDIDVVGLNLLSMMGLALGIDYALLVVSRFREELAGHGDRVMAGQAALRTAGRTILFAGVVLAFAMVTALLVAPGALLASATFGVVIATALSVFGAMTALPAMLAVLGPNINRWSFGRSGAGESALGGAALGALKRPAVAAALVLGFVGLLAAPALGLQTGPPDPRVLPEDADVRVDYEAIDEALGAGWMAPYEITVAAENGPITNPKRLTAMERFQRRIAARDDVRAVLGPARIAERTQGLDQASGRLRQADAAVQRGLRGQQRLADGLGRADQGVAVLRAGLSQAASGAQRLHHGGRQAADGSDRVLAGLRKVRRGAAALEDATGRLLHGAQRIAEGLAQARNGVGAAVPKVQRLANGLDRGADGLRRLREPARIAETELDEALRALDDMLPTSKLDPRYREVYESVARASGAVTGRHPLTGEPVRPGYDGLVAELTGAATQLDEAAAGTQRLVSGLEQLDQGLVRLSAGAERLMVGMQRTDVGAGRLVEGIDRLTAGTERLASGLQRLETGTERLGAGLREGAARTGQLRAGTTRMRAGVLAAMVSTKQLTDGLSGAQRLGDALRSGYFVLAALDGSDPAVRRSSTFAVNLDNGGSAAQIAVIGKGDMSRAGHGLRPSLERELDRLEREADVVTGIGGPAAVLQDFDSELSGRFPWLVAAISIITLLVLVPVLRSLLLPLLAVLLNLITVAAAFGVLVFLFVGDGPLAGTGYIDAIMVGGIFSIVFGLSIDYEVFLLARMREGRMLTGTTEGAIAYGLRHTAGVITGAALIMTGVFVAFAMSDVASLQQLGIGLTVAVLLDATLIRLVLLPAVIRLCGEASWWLPGWLDRLLPSRESGNQTVRMANV